jgi:hypothetical protein
MLRGGEEPMLMIMLELATTRKHARDVARERGAVIKYFIESLFNADTRKGEKNPFYAAL